MPSPGASLSPNSYMFTNWKLSEPCPFGFLWRIITWVWLIKSLALVTDSTSSPSPLSGSQSHASIHGWFPCNHPPSLGHLININPVMVERGLSWITRHPFHLYGSSDFRNWKQETKYLWQKMLQLLLSLRKFQGLWELRARNPEWRPNNVRNIFWSSEWQIHFSYKLQCCNL